MVARSRDGEVTSYPVTETVHKSSICYVTQTPAQIPQELQDQAKQMAEKAVGCLGGMLLLPEMHCRDCMTPGSSNICVAVKGSYNL